MKVISISVFFLLALVASSCVYQEEESCGTSAELAERVIKDAVEAHGGNAYLTIALQFKFREYNYTWEESPDHYKYTRQLVDDTSGTVDVYEEGKFSRLTNGIENNLSLEMMDKYSNSINSVIYFLALPYRLKDEAVIAEYSGELESHHTISVKFKKEGGGEDFEDEYFYWFNKESNQLEFLAYNYQVNGGRARFRKAYNPRIVAGILFQDYINYEAPVDIPLKDLFDLYELDSLVELSRIETEDIRPLN